jgi:hypothetical protein
MWVYRDDINSLTLVGFDRLGAAAIITSSLLTHALCDQIAFLFFHERPLVHLDLQSFHDINLYSFYYPH